MAAASRSLTEWLEPTQDVFSRARNLQTCRFSRLRRWRWSSISKQRKRWGSYIRFRCLRSPTRGSNRIRPLGALWQRYEFGRVARDEVEARGFPIGFGGFDAVFARGDEIPPDMARAVHCRAADDDKVSIFRGFDLDAVARLEH